MSNIYVCDWTAEPVITQVKLRIPSLPPLGSLLFFHSLQPQFLQLPSSVYRQVSTKVH